MTIIGYLFATTLGFEKAGLSNFMRLCLLSLLCLVLSAFSVFYLISFLGGFLALTALVIGFTRPEFKTLSKGEAFFLAEVGSMLVASFSSIFILMWVVSSFFQTYAFGSYGSFSPYALLGVEVLSFLMFFAIPFMDVRGINVGLSGAFGLLLSSLSFVSALQNRYALLNPTAYLGIFMLVLGYVLVLVGDLMCLRVFLKELQTPSITLVSSPLEQGKYCPYCGKPREIASQVFCYHCRRSLLWAPNAPFCTSCGQLVPTSAQMCPHCQDNIRDKGVYFHTKDLREQKIADRLVAKSMKRRPWMIRGLSKMSRALKPGVDVFPSVRLPLDLMDAVFIVVAACVFSFLFFWGVRVLVLMVAK